MIVIYIIILKESETIMKKANKVEVNGQEANIETKRTKSADHQEKHTHTKSRVNGR